MKTRRSQWLERLRADPVTQRLNLGALVVSIAALLASFGPPALMRWITALVPLAGGAALLWVLRQQRPKRLDDPERGVWSDLTLGAALMTVAYTLPAFDGGAWVEFVAQALQVAGYGVLLLITVRRPWKRLTFGTETLERELVMPALLYWVAGAYGYFALLPVLHGGSLALAREPVTQLLLLLAATVAGRTTWLAMTVPSRRWSLFHATLALASWAVTALHALRWLEPAQPLGTFGPLWVGPLWLTLIGVRGLALSAPRPGRDLPEGDELPPSLAERTLLLALSALVLHYAGSVLGLFDPALSASRELWALAWAVGLGAVAIAQGYFQSDRLREIDAERRRIEQMVMSVEARHRLATERERAQEIVARSRDRFHRAFASARFGLAITDFETGRHLEANRAYARHFGLTPEEVIGKTGFELGLWSSAKEREALLSRLGPQTDQVEMKVRGVRGDTRWVQISAETALLDGRRAILAVVRDITDDHAARLEIERKAGAWRDHQRSAKP